MMTDSLPSMRITKHTRDMFTTHTCHMIPRGSVGIPGQGGSNNGGEARGGEIKNSWRSITKKCNKEAKKSHSSLLQQLLWT